MSDPDGDAAVVVPVMATEPSGSRSSSLNRVVLVCAPRTAF
jgi:hypothetical protein